MMAMVLFRYFLYKIRYPSLKSVTFAGVNNLPCMKKIYFLIFILWMPFFVLSQETDVKQSSQTSKNTYLDLLVGAAFPLGNSYPSTDEKNKKAGYATTGFLVQASFDWMGKRNLGIAFQLTYQNNPINDKVRDDTLEGNVFPVGSSNWQNIYIMAGPVFLKRIHRFIIDAKATGGFIISTGPVFSMTNPETRQKENKTATGFGLGVSTGAAFEVSKHFALRLNLGYLAGFPSVSQQYNAYQYWDPVLQQIIYTAPSEKKISKTVSTFNGGAGAIIMF
jgi:hypothetical protein